MLHPHASKRPTYGHISIAARARAAATAASAARARSRGDMSRGDIGGELGLPRLAGAVAGDIARGDICASTTRQESGAVAGEAGRPRLLGAPPLPKDCRLPRDCREDRRAGMSSARSSRS